MELNICKKNRITSNTDIFDFELSMEDVAYLDSGERIGPYPDHFDF